MKETGLMFKAPLVRAILSGQKIQTRRVVKRQPAPGQGMVNAAYCGDRHLWLRDGRCSESDPAYEWRCPVGKPGDRIYVRETFVQGYEEDRDTGVLLTCDEEGNEIPKTTWYRATNRDLTWSNDGESEVNVPWKPAIHMPKALARLWLEVTGVRMERLQSISEDDCITEGIHALPHQAAEPGCWWTSDVAAGAALHGRTPRNAFQLLWESTGGDWHANPWVWVIDFKRIEKP